MKTWRPIIISAVGVIIVLALILPALPKAKIGGGPGCLYYLKRIQIAKQMYADDYRMTNDVVLTQEQLLPYLGGKWPQCPKGGEYSIGRLHESPRCSFPAHADLQVPAN